MNFLYHIGIYAYGAGIYTASIFNKKAKLWVKGRTNWLEKIENNIPPTERIIWFHSSSLGEVEQGLPVIERVKSNYPDHKVLLTFFSPSGYENFSGHPSVDYKLYLPLDTRSNAENFISLVNPDLAFFIKYDIWGNYITQLHKLNIPTILAPAVFKPKQFYFSALGKWIYKPVFKKLSSIIVQDTDSATELKKLDINNAIVCGDSRFDRSVDVASEEYKNDRIEEFCNGDFTLIGGSTYKAEEEMILEWLKNTENTQAIIAPHHIDASNTKRLIKLFAEFNPVRYTSNDPIKINSRVLILNTIGLLKHIYRYGNMAFIGGGFGKSVHSTIEPAAHKIAVCFGPNHKKFIEPSEMIKWGVGFEINNTKDFLNVCSKMQNLNNRAGFKELCQEYLDTKTGSVDKIMDEIKRLL